MDTTHENVVLFVCIVQCPEGFSGWERLVSGGKATGYQSLVDCPLKRITSPNSHEGRQVGSLDIKFSWSGRSQS